ncbi:PREDICTED: zinc finger protein 33B-like, partial [Poecilia mexicana]|uniref:zinc finger protein 33B-like n=1 Tax=Poecilia mexicana TaxID=48701 RepID=UPI00072E7C70
MSVIRQDVAAHYFVLNQQEISVLDQREAESLKTERRAEEPELRQVKEEEYGSEPLINVKKDKNIKQETDTLMGTHSGSLEIKEEPEEIELQQLKDDYCQSESQQMVKIEVDNISQDENQEVLKQETDTLTITDSGSLELKEEPEELETKEVKEEEHGSGPQQMAEKDAVSISLDEKQDALKQEIDNLITKTSDGETNHQQPQLKGNQILFQNTPETDHHQKIKTHNKGQSGNVEKGMEGRKTYKGKNYKQCTVCGKKFKCRSNLISHMKTHRNENPFSCLTCGKCLSRKQSLDRHMMTHTGEKPFSCLTCGKGFTQKSSLDQHMKTHTGERPFSCLTCGKDFIQKSRWTCHMKIHKVERPFSCITCGKGFIKKYSLTCHMRTHTDEK